MAGVTTNPTSGHTSSRRRRLTGIRERIVGDVLDRPETFATAGAIVATDAGVSAFGVVAVGTINAVGGGAFADVPLDRSPFVLFEDCYASPAVLGGTAYWVVATVTGSGSTAAAAPAAVTVGTRMAAVSYGWTLPTAPTLEPVGDEIDDD
jgi:uncharacterized membrane protein YeiH